MEQEIKVGDAVKLKSGGPWMTVIGIYNDKVQCIWFDKDEKLQGYSDHGNSYYFLKEALEK